MLDAQSSSISVESISFGNTAQFSGLHKGSDHLAPVVVEFFELGSRDRRMTHTLQQSRHSCPEQLLLELWWLLVSLRTWGGGVKPPALPDGLSGHPELSLGPDQQTSLLSKSESTLFWGRGAGLCWGSAELQPEHRGRDIDSQPTFHFTAYTYRLIFFFICENLSLFCVTHCRIQG